MTTLEASTAVRGLSASSDHTTALAAPAAPFPWDTAEPCPDRLETGSYSIGDYVRRNSILAKLLEQISVIIRCHLTVSPFGRHIYLYQTPITSSGNIVACGAATASPEALVAVSMTVPNVYRDPEVATNMTLPFHWDALIVNDLYKNFPSQVSIWASLNVNKNTNFPIHGQTTASIIS